MFVRLYAFGTHRPRGRRDEESEGDFPAAGDDGTPFLDTADGGADNHQVRASPIFAPWFSMLAARRSWSVVIVAFSTLPALLPVVGCGRAEYEAEVNRTIDRLKIENQFRSLEPVPIVLAVSKAEGSPLGTKVTFRKPLIYNEPPFNAASMDPKNPTLPIPQERLKPTFLTNFPGFYQTWEKAPVTQRTDSVAIIYAGVQPSEPGLRERIIADIKTALPDLPELNWGQMSAQTPEPNKKIDWWVLNFDHGQEYSHLNQPFQIGSKILILLREEQGKQVIIAARWSEAAGDLRERYAELLAAAGTVQVASNVKID